MDGRRFIGVLQEVEKRLIRVSGLPDNLIRQDVLTEILAVVGLCRTDRVVGEPVRFRVGVGVERTLVTASRPEPAAAQFARIALHHDPVPDIGCAAGMAGCIATGKPSAREIHCTPEEMHRAYFSDEAGPELAEYAVGLEQLAPEQVR